jgi:hypothetical protein
LLHLGDICLETSVAVWEGRLSGSITSSILPRCDDVGPGLASLKSKLEDSEDMAEERNWGSHLS